MLSVSDERHYAQCIGIDPWPFQGGIAELIAGVD